MIFHEGDGLGEGYGMLGQAGSGKLRVSVGQSKLAAKVAKKYDFLLLFVFHMFRLCLMVTKQELN